MTYRETLRTHDAWTLREVYQRPGMHRDYVVGWWISCALAAVCLALAWPAVLAWRSVR